MPYQKTPITQTPYVLVAFDANGDERNHDPDAQGGLLSTRLLSQLSETQPSDVFLFSHGWRGDMKAAIDQYDRWIDAMAQMPADAARMGPNFKPLWLGVHWPSEPWGDEEFSGAAAFGLVAAADPNEGKDLRSAYLERLDLQDSPEAHALLELILSEQQQNAAARSLPKGVADAYDRLAQLMAFEPKGPGAEPGNDTVAFDPVAAFDAMNSSSVAFGGGFVGGLLSPLRTLSFWNMKRRARRIGEKGVRQLVAKLQNAMPGGSFHLMGHSFGSIVVSSICGSSDETGWLPRPVDSMALVQSAVSLWSYADKVQNKSGPGYYNTMYRKPAIRGPVITTQSIHDLAVSRWYKAAVGLALASPDFGDNINLIRWGAIGQYGIQGLPDLQTSSMLTAGGDYQFENGKVYNLESSQFICKGGGTSGAHSDIDGPEVAHALWQAALSSKTPQRTLFAAAGAPPTLPIEKQPPQAPNFSVQSSAPATMPTPFGVQAETGQYLPFLQASDLEHVGRDSGAIDVRGGLGEPTLGVVESIDASDLAQTGWGVIFSNNMAQDRVAVRDALRPLLDRRREQSGPFYAEFAGDSGYTTGIPASDWLADCGSGLAVVNPRQGVPYYLLLVGSEEDIPFDFQYDLDTFFAVGRVYFNGVDEYRRYAENLVAYEKAETLPHGKSAAVFAPRNPGDAATQMLHDLVAAPMALGDPSLALEPLGKSRGYTTIARLKSQAKKPDLLDLLGGKGEGGYPALLFTGSHGVAFALDDPQQRLKQGALLTQDWGGPGTPVKEDTYLTGAEVAGSASTLGMIHYFFACYSAACPTHDTYSYDANDKPVEIAKKPIIARLPQQLLLNGAQAVIGHVDRAWAYSFQSGRGVTLAQNVRDPLDRILAGSRVGHAMDFFNQRWSVLSGQLVKLLDRRAAVRASVSDVRLANCWVERDDARNYVILGDPASKLRT